MTNFGVRNIGTGQVPEDISVTDSSTEMIPPNSLRSSCFMLNPDKNDVWYSMDESAIFEKGNLLGKNGGHVLLDAAAITLGPINGICASGKTALITFQELNING